MRSVAISSSIDRRLNRELRSIRIGSFFNDLASKYALFLLERSFKRQLKTLDQFAATLEEYIEASLELEYVDAAQQLPWANALKRRWERATKRMCSHKESILSKVANAPGYFERLERVLNLLKALMENLTMMEYLTHDAKFLLGLPDDTRYKVMSFAMARVHAAMDKDPVAKAEYEAEIAAWMNAPLDPILEYEDEWP
jgi:hypothetical protein